MVSWHRDTVIFFQIWFVYKFCDRGLLILISIVLSLISHYRLTRSEFRTVFRSYGNANAKKTGLTILFAFALLVLFFEIHLLK